MADNSLNVSELFRRLGVKGDSLGSAPLLESLRLNLLIGDLSQLVPPLAGPFAAAAIGLTSGAATRNKWSLQCRSPGGLRVQTLHSDDNLVFFVFVTDADPFGAILSSAAHDFSFGQTAQSIFNAHTPAVAVAPVNAYRLYEGIPTVLPSEFETWVGPGQFFNIESLNNNVQQVMSISWREYPGAISPG